MRIASKIVENDEFYVREHSSTRGHAAAFPLTGLAIVGGTHLQCEFS
jgi:hypothetical protein